MCFYEKVINVKADVAASICLISFLVAFGTSGPSVSCSLWLSPHFRQKILRQDRAGATTGNSVDREYPPVLSLLP